MSALKILFAWPAPELAVWDVAVGMRSALAQRGHRIIDFAYNKRLNYHASAMGPASSDDPATIEQRQRAIMQMASESIVIEALKSQADVVLLVCGLNFHPVGAWLLRQIGVPVVIALTESPYEDPNQAIFVEQMQADAVLTNERTSIHYGWTYMRHAYDPATHQPSTTPDTLHACDVLMVGTGWGDRQRLLEAVDWTGIHLQLLGMWPEITATSPLFPYYRECIVENTHLPHLYAAAKICLNVHRFHPTAESLNPRAFEIAACGAFQLCDRRAEAAVVFGDTVPTFDGPQQLEALIRCYLSDDLSRRQHAESARQRVLAETFLQRAPIVEQVLLAALQRS